MQVLEQLDHPRLRPREPLISNRVDRVQEKARTSESHLLVGGLLHLASPNGVSGIHWRAGIFVFHVNYRSALPIVNIVRSKAGLATLGEIIATARAASVPWVTLIAVSFNILFSNTL